VRRDTGRRGDGREGRHPDEAVDAFAVGDDVFRLILPASPFFPGILLSLGHCRR
jgi:hypothetical protein